jgi:PKD repeat protein
VQVTVLSTVAVQGPITGPSGPVPLGTSVQASAAIGGWGTLAATWDWGDGTLTSGQIQGPLCAGSHLYAVPGVYTITLTVRDGGGQSSAPAIYQFAVVYDPNGGFVTGGGWIDSPRGAYTPDTSLTGKATFGFVSKYKKGATVPSGETRFQFKTAGLDFESDTYQWLVVAGAQAQFRGEGSVNGLDGYDFFITAIDGEVAGGGRPDTFRIKIWDRNSGGIVYDNLMHAPDTADPTTTLGGGSIVVHK